MEEEQFIASVIHDFELGLLDIPQDTHLRKYISRLLNCEDMRISKVSRVAACTTLSIVCLFVCLSKWCDDDHDDIDDDDDDDDDDDVNDDVL